MTLRIVDYPTFVLLIFLNKVRVVESADPATSWQGELFYCASHRKSPLSDLQLQH